VDDISGSTKRGWSRRKIMIAVLASIGIFAMVATTLAAMVMPLLLHGDESAQRTASRTTTTPTAYIAPLTVRPVVAALVATPEQCQPGPPPPPTPPTEPLRTCDVEQKAEYQLGPEALRLSLTGASSVKLPMTEFYAVQLTMAPGSGANFGQYTGTQVGKQVAFVRDGVVLAAPAISAPLNGDSLQLSGELTAATAETIARMLREGT
jgi:preprotein translocase subunit SecD